MDTKIIELPYLELNEKDVTNIINYPEKNKNYLIKITPLESYQIAEVLENVVCLFGLPLSLNNELIKLNQKITDANIIEEEFKKLSENILSSILSLQLSFNEMKNTVNEINNKLINKEDLDLEEIKEQITSTIQHISHLSSNNGVSESTLLEIIRTVSK